MDDTKRRQFLKHLAAATGAAVVAPIAITCGGGRCRATAAPSEQSNGRQTRSEADSDIPLTIPDDWNPIEFNRQRGNKGAIPDTYLADINGPEGELKHLGKHLPYIPEVDPSLAPDHTIPIMWGDPKKGYAMHPNSPKGDPSYPRGHFFDWVRVRKATDADAEEVTSTYSNWPETASSDSGKLAAEGNGSLEENTGKNTVYLLKLPRDVSAGDPIRIYGHCLYHGEYVDFIAALPISYFN